MTGVYFDEGFFTHAQKLGVQHVTCHPLPNAPLKSKRMRAYFKRLATIQERTGIPILIENLPQTYRSGLLHHFFPPTSDANDMVQLHEITSEFGLGITLDTDHLHVPKPHKQAWFSKVLPQVENIHLSSFDKDTRHLPLYMGDLRTVEFTHYLQKKNYTGSITLEVSWPKSITMWNYDFDAIRKSLDLLHK
jgi:sugar phosphate isomerase/epimerase